MKRLLRLLRLLLIALVCAFSAFSSAFAAGAEYRALLIGEQRFLWFYDDGDWLLDERNQRNIGDVDNLIQALTNVTGPEAPWGPFSVTRKTNLSRSGIRDAIRSTFADTKEQDLSIFFIATHGDETSDGDLCTAFTGRAGNAADREKYRKSQWLSFDTLAKWLKTYVKGRVFVILESCGSGSAIYDPAVPENKGSGGDAAAERFVRRAVEAFSAADPGLSFAVPGRSTGDLRNPKFYVLTASAHEEKSYGWETGNPQNSYNFFTKWLTEGIGKKGNSPADRDGDGVLSLDELFQYLKPYDTIQTGELILHQHVQRYPIDNADPLLRLSDPVTPTPSPAPTPTPTPRPVPETGDPGSPGLWLALIPAGLAGAAAALFAFPGKRKKKKI